MNSFTSKLVKQLRVASDLSQVSSSSESFNNDDANDEVDTNGDLEDDAILCGKIGQAPVQKILRNGRTVTIFTLGTGGMCDRRIMGAEPKPAQWHRIAVHSELLGAYAVQQLVKGDYHLLSPVFVEGDIETGVYNDSINGQVKNVPEVCVRRDGKICLIKTGEGVTNINFDDLKDGLFSKSINTLKN
ncbi:hypothetical protein MKX01_016272 [Papaver californicum]|nr:hypothetical protein MKX01_016272 [Papaver californicum]